MKKILSFILILLLFFACKTPSKIIDTSQSYVRDNTQVNIEETHEKQEQITTVTTTATDENSTVVEETTKIEYDTEKPVDESTGRPPVKSETITKKTTTTGKQVNEQTQVAAEIVETHNVVDQTKVDVETTTVTTHEQTPQKPKVAYYYYILLILAILAGIGGIFYVGRRFRIF